MKAHSLLRLSQGGSDAAHKIIDRLNAIFGSSHLYIELQRHRPRDQECRNQALLALASSLAPPCHCHQWRPLCDGADRELFDVLTAIRNHTTLDKAGRLLAQLRSGMLRPAARNGRALSRYSRGRRQYRAS